MLINIADKNELSWYMIKHYKYVIKKHKYIQYLYVIKYKL